MKDLPAERQAALMLQRLRDLDEWQEKTERRLMVEQERERNSVMKTSVLLDNNDTEDDTVSSMEYDHNDHNDNPEQMTEDQVNLLYLRNNLHKTEVDDKDPQTAPPNVERKPRAFLKRGSGLARFNLPTDLDQQPNRIKKKQPNIKNLPSKYTEETQAFIARKAEIRKSRENLQSDIPKVNSASIVFRPRSRKNVRNVTKVSPVLKQIINKQRDDKTRKSLSRQVSSCDSVEHSFKEKLSLQSQRQDKEKKELEVFEMLEGATLNSSFSSTNSNINNLMERSILPSPSKPKLSHPQPTQERINKHCSEDDSTNPSLGETLLQDIQQFINRTGDCKTAASVESESDSSTIICEDKEGNITGSEGSSSDDVVCVENSNVYNPSIYDQCKSSQSSAVEVEEEDVSHTVSVLKIRIHELEAEVEKYKIETSRIKDLNEEISREKKSLELSLENYKQEKAQQSEEMKQERDRVKSLHPIKKISQGKIKGCTDCNENRNKIVELEENLRERDLRYRHALTQLNGQLSAAKRENLELRNGNHRLKIKYATSKVGDMLRGRRSHSNPSLSEEVQPQSDVNSRTRKLTQCTVEQKYKDKPRPPESQKIFEFSSADSLESSVSLVSGATPSLSESEVTEVIVDPERGTREKRYKDGRQEVWYSNGNRKEISSDGRTVKVHYYNGDLKEVDGSGVTRYLYQDTQTWHTSHPDGREVTVFSNGQTEEKFPDGRQVITFSDGTLKKISAEGEEEISFPDNTVVLVDRFGDRVVKMPETSKKHVRKSLKTTLERRIERNSFPVTSHSHNVDVMVL